MPSFKDYILLTEDLRSTNRLLRKAIKNRYIVDLIYRNEDGVLEGYRNIEPVALGKSSKGNFLLRAWQREGVSYRDKPKGWKLFRPDRIVDIEVIENRKFNRKRKLYNPKGDKTMSKVELNAKF